MCEHIVRLRSHKALANSPAIVLPESNLANAAINITERFDTFGLRNYLILYDQKNMAPGSITTNASKQMLAAFLRDRLAEGAVAPMLDFLSVSVGRALGMTLGTLWDELIMQLGGFTAFHTEGRKTKLHGNQCHDDMVMALMIALWSYLIFKHQKEAFLEPSPFNHITTPHLRYERMRAAHQ